MTGTPFNQTEPNRAWERYRQSEDFLNPHEGMYALERAFCRGWNAQIEWERDRREHQFVDGGAGTAMICYMIALILGGSVTMLLFTFGRAGVPVNWFNVTIMYAVTLGFVALGRFVRRRGKPKAEIANRAFQSKWGNVIPMKAVK